MLILETQTILQRRKGREYYSTPPRNPLDYTAVLARNNGLL
jgi:hypothetical protein